MDTSHGGWVRAPQLLIGAAMVIASIVVPSALGSAYWAHNFLIVNLFVTVAVAQNMLLADAGQVSFGQGAVFGLAAYVVGIIAGMWGHGFIPGLLGGMAGALLLGLVFALPALRVQGYYLGFVTLSAAVVFPEMLIALNDITNGINGINFAVPALETKLGAGLSGLSLLVMVLACATLAAHAWLRSTRTGRRMLVAAVSPEAALTLGINPGRLRFLAFTIAAFISGLAGVLYVPVVGFVSPYAFRVDLSIFFFFSVIIGGQGQLLGPVIGAWILYLVPNALLANWSDYRLLGYGAVALLIMLAFPDGVIGSIAAAARRRTMRTRVADIRVEGIETGWTAPPPPRPDTATPAIAVHHARKNFGRLAALDDVGLTVTAGQIHGLVGPNGSGKTTLLNVISGLIPLTSGQVLVHGRDTTRAAAHSLARLGIGRTFQTPRVFEAMTIWENLEIGADLRQAEAGRRLLALLEPYRAEWASNHPDLMAHAQRRVLEVLRVVASDADILLLDEPAAGLSPEERRGFADLLVFLRDRLGKTILLVEHDLHLVWRVADRITVLDTGRIVAEGPPDVIAADPRVRALFTGSVDA